MAFLTLPSERWILGRARRPAAAGFKGAFGLKNSRQGCEGRFRMGRECVSLGVCGDGVKPKASTRRLYNARMTGGCDWEFQGSWLGFPLSPLTWGARNLVCNARQELAEHGKVFYTWLQLLLLKKEAMNLEAGPQKKKKQSGVPLQSRNLRSGAQSSF